MFSKAFLVGLAGVFCWLLNVGPAAAYIVGPPLNLDKLEAEADLIFKGEATADATVADESFHEQPGYVVRETHLKIISKIKGDPGGAVVFRHYDEDKSGGFFVSGYTPQLYHFETGQTYIVFANKVATGARQVRMAHTGKMDLGVLRCRDGRPVTERTLPALYWAELIALRESPAPADVLYSIQQLDELSEAGDDRFGHTSDFSRVDVLAALRPLMARPEPEIAQAAIRVIGAGSPYLRNEQAPYWLGTVGVGSRGLSQMEQGMRNAGAALCWRDLAAVANGNAAAETRALAIRSLGLVKASDLESMIYRQWRKAPEPPVRAAAALLLADFADHGKYIGQQFDTLVADPEPEVRVCAAYAIGFVQNPVGTSMLVSLLKDKDRNVRKAAAQSLLSFRPEHPEVAAAFKASLGLKEFHPLFLVALARSNPGAHLEALAKVVEEKAEPENSDGGRLSAFTAWETLFRYLRECPVKELQAGKWDRYLNALEKVVPHGSGEPTNIYAFYVRSGLRERAAKYRAAAKKAVSYDMDLYFDRVDKDPAAYPGN